MSNQTIKKIRLKKSELPSPVGDNTQLHYNIRYRMPHHFQQDPLSQNSLNYIVGSFIWASAIIFAVILIKELFSNWF